MSFDIVNITVLIVIGFVVSLYLILSYVTKNNKRLIKNSTVKKPNIAIVIPARDESLVIESILKSIVNQTYKVDMKDVYVIVEDKCDKTVDIVSKYKGNVFVRKSMDIKTKGYAIDEVVQDVFSKNKKYDLFYIFDADNIMDKDFIKNSLKSYYDGYDIMIGYRNSKNGNDNLVAASSTLIFSLLNSFMNSYRIKENKNVLLSGTGFFIRGDVLKKIGGYKFYSLTEDYELTMYALLNDLTSYYNEECVYYDEQPIKLNKSIIQRTRWVKGYFSVRRKYLKLLKSKVKTTKYNKMATIGEMVDMKLLIILVSSYVIFIINNFIKLIITNEYFYLINFIFSGILLYLILFYVSYILLKKETKLNLSKKMRKKVVFYNPFFLATFVNCAIKALFSKNLGWEKIEHCKNKIN